MKIKLLDAKGKRIGKKKKTTVKNANLNPYYNESFVFMVEQSKHSLHTVNSGSEMVEAKHVSGKNICWSTLIAKSLGRKKFHFLHCPFEGRFDMHHKIQPYWPNWQCYLAGGSKGQCRK